jgi:hypothetical protein
MRGLGGGGVDDGVQVLQLVQAVSRLHSGARRRRRANVTFGGCGRCPSGPRCKAQEWHAPPVTAGAHAAPQQHVARPALVQQLARAWTAFSASHSITLWLNTASASPRRRARLISGARESAGAKEAHRGDGPHPNKQSAVHRLWAAWAVAAAEAVAAAAAVAAAPAAAPAAAAHRCLLTDDPSVVGVQAPLHTPLQGLQEGFRLRHQLRHLHLQGRAGRAHTRACSEARVQGLPVPGFRGRLQGQYGWPAVVFPPSLPPSQASKQDTRRQRRPGTASPPAASSCLPAPSHPRGRFLQRARQPMPRRGRWVRGLRTPDKTSLLLLAPGLAPLNKERHSSRLRSPAGCHCSRNQSLCTPAVLWAASTCPQPAQRHQRASPDCSSPASSSCSCCVPSSAVAPLASSCCCSAAAAAARAAACFLAPFFDLLAASASSFSIAASCTAGQGQRKRECGTRRWAQRPAIA